MNAKGEPFDMIVTGYEAPKGKKILLRVQVKTVGGGSVHFIGGSRGGVDREYISDVKTYKYTTEHSDLIIGIDSTTLDLYLVPTDFTTSWGTSKAVSMLQPLKNNWDILLNWRSDFLNALGQKIGIRKVAVGQRDLTQGEN